MTNWRKTKVYRIKQSIDPGGMDSVIRHIDHIVNRVGIDNVGIGPDYDMGRPPRGLETADCIPALAVALMKNGYSRKDVAKIMGRNFMRVFRQVLREK